MDYYNTLLQNSLLDIKQITSREMSIKNDLIKNLHSTNKSLTDLVNFQQDVITCIMTIYRKHIVKLLALSSFNIHDKINLTCEGTIMQQAAKIQEMVQVMQSAIAIDSQEPLNNFQEMARLQKENKDLRELLNIANQFGSFFMPTDKETQTDEYDRIENLKVNFSITSDINEECTWNDPDNKCLKEFSVTRKLSTAQVSNEANPLKSPATEIVKSEGESATVVLAELPVTQPLQILDESNNCLKI